MRGLSIGVLPPNVARQRRRPYQPDTLWALGILWTSRKFVGVAFTSFEDVIEGWTDKPFLRRPTRDFLLPFEDLPVNADLTDLNLYWPVPKQYLQFSLVPPQTQALNDIDSKSSFEFRRVTKSARNRARAYPFV